MVFNFISQTTRSDMSAVKKFVSLSFTDNFTDIIVTAVYRWCTFTGAEIIWVMLDKLSVMSSANEICVPTQPVENIFKVF